MIDCGRYYLRAMRTEDISSIVELVKSDTAKMISYEFGKDMEAPLVEEYFNALLTDESGDKLIFIAFLKKSNKCLGYAAVTNIDWKGGSAETSIMIDEKYQCVGYGTFIISSVGAYCFKELNLIKLYSKVRGDNTRIPERTRGQLQRKVPIDSNTSFDFYYSEILKEDIPGLADPPINREK